MTVYTAVEAEDLARYAETFNKDHPDIQIKWVRDSTGIVTENDIVRKVVAPDGISCDTISASYNFV